VRRRYLPGRVNDNPEGRGTGERVQQNLPTIVARKDVVSSHVIKRKRKRGQDRGNQSQGIDSESAPSDPDSQGAAEYREGNGGHARHRRLLLPTRHQVEQDPSRRRVLQDDGCGDVGLLNSQIVEVIRGGDSENSEHNGMQKIFARQFQSLPAAHNH
jgi:hypothetical protein